MTTLEAVPVNFEPNNTLDMAMAKAVDEKSPGFFDRLSIRIALLRPRKRYQLEKELTRQCMLAGVIPYESTEIADGVFVGNWLVEIFDWIIANWETVLEIISAILLFF